MRKTFKILCECRCCGDLFPAEFVYDPADVAGSFVVDELQVYDAAGIQLRTSEVFFTDRESAEAFASWLRAGRVPTRPVKLFKKAPG